MTSKVSLDIRIANYISRRLNGYIAKKWEKKAALAKEKWLGSFHGKASMVFKLEEDLAINLYADSLLSKLIFEGFETDEIDFLNSYLVNGDSFLDIGANVGLFSLYAAKRVGKEGLVISFEPSRKTYERLVENCELNKLENIKTAKLGLADKEDQLELNISSDGHEAWNTFVKSDDSKFSSTEMVTVKPLDGFLRENAVDTDKISLIKLDVEGFEINVLKGATALLSKKNAPTFMVEFTDDNANAAGHCCHEIYTILVDHGYTWFTYDYLSKKLIREKMRVNYPYNNLIAVKDPGINQRVAKFL